MVRKMIKQAKWLHLRSGKTTVPRKADEEEGDVLLQDKDDSAATALLSLGSGLLARTDSPFAQPKRVIVSSHFKSCVSIDC